MTMREFGSLAVALLIAATLALGGYALFAAFIDKLNSINSEVGKAIVVAGFTGLGATIAVVLGKIWEQKIRIAQEIREKKIPVYEQQFATMFRVIFADKLGEKKVTDRDLAKAFASFTEKIVIWGSPSVIRAWADFRSYDWSNARPEVAMFKFEDFAFALRRDVGNKNGNLPRGSLLALFINDMPQTMETSELSTSSRI